MLKYRTEDLELLALWLLLDLQEVLRDHNRQESSAACCTIPEQRTVSQQIFMGAIILDTRSLTCLPFLFCCQESLGRGLRLHVSRGGIFAFFHCHQHICQLQKQKNSYISWFVLLQDILSAVFHLLFYHFIYLKRCCCLMVYCKFQVFFQALDYLEL